MMTWMRGTFPSDAAPSSLFLNLDDMEARRVTTPSNLESPVFHPLVSQIATPVSRRAAILGACGLLAMRLPAGAGAQESAGTPELDIQGEEDAVALLERSAQALADLETFAFGMETVRGASTVLAGFELKSVSGVVRRPTDLSAEVEVSIPLGNLTVGAVSLDGTFWIQDPLSDGTWMELGQMGEIQTLINPDFLILQAVKLVQNAEIVGDSEVDGVETTMVEGEVDFSGLLDRFGGVDPDAQAQIEDFIADEPVLMTFWIDAEDRIREVEMIGPILSSETDDVVRVVTLSAFNEEVEIERPAVVATPGA